MSKPKRKLAAAILLTAHGQLSTLLNLTISHYVLRECSAGMTEREREYLQQVRIRMDKDTERLRKLAWRLKR